MYRITLALFIIAILVAGVFVTRNASEPIAAHAEVTTTAPSTTEAVTTTVPETTTTAAPTTLAPVPTTQYVAPTTVKPAPKPTVPPTTVPRPTTTVPQTVPSSHSGNVNSFLACVRQRESGGNYRAMNPSGAAGAYQLMPVTARNTALHAGRPDLANTPVINWSAADQDAMALSLYNWQGRAPWSGGQYPC